MKGLITSALDYMGSQFWSLVYCCMRLKDLDYIESISLCLYKKLVKDLFLVVRGSYDDQI